MNGTDIHLPTKQGGLKCQVILLDGAMQIHYVQKSDSGSQLYNQVFKRLQLLETDYFGLEFTNREGDSCWLDLEKQISSQIAGREASFTFKVKFYTPDPTLIEDDLTRYLFSLQIKQDLATGLLHCTRSATAILAAYIVQSELGDFSVSYTDHTYLKGIKLLKEQTDEMEMEIMEQHKALMGLSVIDSEFQLLDLARRSDTYGVVTFACTDPTGNELRLAVLHNGLHIYAGKMSQPIKSFNWSTIRKLGFKRKRFLIKLYSTDQSALKSDDLVYEYVFKSRDAAKSMWKLSVEQHSFFRREATRPVRRSKRLILSRGSSFRYAGRTQKQLVEEMKSQKSMMFERSASLRSFRSLTLRPPMTRSVTYNNGFNSIGYNAATMTLGRQRPANLNLMQSSINTADTAVSVTSPSGGSTQLPVSHSMGHLSPVRTAGRPTLGATSISEYQLGSGQHGASSEHLAEVAKQVDQLLQQTMVTSPFESSFINTTTLSAKKIVENSGYDPVSFANESSLPASKDRLGMTDAERDNRALAGTVERFEGANSNESEMKFRNNSNNISIDEVLDEIAEVSEHTTMLHIEESSTQQQNQPMQSTHSQRLNQDSAMQMETQTSAAIILYHSSRLSPVYANAPNSTKNVECDTNSMGSKRKLSEHDVPRVNSVSKDNDRKITNMTPTSTENISEFPLPPDVVVLSSPKHEIAPAELSEEVVIALPPLRRHSSRSRAEELSALESLSEIAERVWGDEEGSKLSEITNQVIDMCADVPSKSNPPAVDNQELSDLSELLAEYDTIRNKQTTASAHHEQTHPKPNRQNSTKTLELISDMATDVFSEPWHNDNGTVNAPNGNTAKSKFHSRPRLPNLSSISRTWTGSHNTNMVDSGISLSVEDKIE